MPSVHRDPRSPKGVWYCSYTIKGRRAFRSTGEKSKTKATIICHAWAETERAAEEGSLSESRAAQIINETLARIGQATVQRLRLKDWFQEWLESKTNVCAQIKQRYEFAARTFMGFLGTDSERRFLDTITEADIRRFAASLKAEGRSGVTVNRIVRADLGNAFSRAAKLGKIKYNPIAGVAAEKDSEQQARVPFTPEQVAALIKTTQGTEWEGAIRYAYATGARLQDVANLRWDAVDLQVGLVAFKQRKTGRQTVLAIHPDFESWLLRASIAEERQEFVFPSFASRPSWQLTTEFSDIVRRSGIDAGLVREQEGPRGKSRRNLTFHSLRHTAASVVFYAAAVKETARRITAHSERGSLDRYLHIDVAALKGATMLIPRLPL